MRSSELALRQPSSNAALCALLAQSASNIEQLFHGKTNQLAALQPELQRHRIQDGGGE